MRAKTSLKTQLLVFVACLLALLLTISIVSFRRQKAALHRVQSAFKQDLSVVEKIPPLADALRDIDLSTEEYLLTVNPELLQERKKSINSVHDLISAIEPMTQNQAPQWELFKAKIQAYLKMQDFWIDQKKRGELSSANTMQIILAQSPANELEEIIDQIKAAKLAQLQSKQATVQDIFLYTLSFLIATILTACILIGIVFQLYVLRPLNRLNQGVAKWRAGAPWPIAGTARNREFEAIHQQMKSMADRINSQFHQEFELRQIKEHLVTWITHEFNNAIFVIGTATHELKHLEEAPIPEAKEKMFRLIETRIKSINLAAMNLLNLGKAESGKLSLHASRIEITPLLSQCIESLTLLAEKKGVEILPPASDDHEAVFADPAALRLVLQNLLNNAIKYTPSGGKIKMAYQNDPSDSQKLEVYVQDNGIGISEEDQEKILTGFYRSEEGKLIADGYGVGLLLVKTILEAHGSHLKVSSKKNQGTRFSFELMTIDEA